MGSAVTSSRKAATNRRSAAAMTSPADDSPMTNSQSKPRDPRRLRQIRWPFRGKTEPTQHNKQTNKQTNKGTLKSHENQKSPEKTGRKTLDKTEGQKKWS